MKNDNINLSTCNCGGPVCGKIVKGRSGGKKRGVKAGKQRKQSRG